MVEAGGTVHWCQTPAEARSTVLALCREARARTVTKSKSMIAEEMELNPFLEAHGIEPVETDLGEYIIQLADERPSHIIAPAIHKTKDQVSDLFHEKHRTAERSEAIAELVEEARKTLRPRYLAADVGITGANFLIAETGSIALVTNEGNAELTRLLPRAHIVIATLEKVVPTLEDAATLLRVLARSATGQEFSTYTTFATGPRRPGDADGPEAFHVVLLDNGRSRLLESPTFRDVLRCIKCGACMNHCPVYGAVGGHAYGWVYPGPIGAVLTPNLIGLEEAPASAQRLEFLRTLRGGLPHAHPPAGDDARPARGGVRAQARAAGPAVGRRRLGLARRQAPALSPRHRPCCTPRPHCRGRARGLPQASPCRRLDRRQGHAGARRRDVPRLVAQGAAAVSAPQGAREAVFASIRRALGRGALEGEARAEAERRLAAHEPNLTPARAALPKEERDRAVRPHGGGDHGDGRPGGGMRAPFRRRSRIISPGTICQAHSSWRPTRLSMPTPGRKNPCLPSAEAGRKRAMRYR